MTNETQAKANESARPITTSDIKVYEARTNAMLASVTEQRDAAQYQVIQLRGEIAALQTRLSTAGDTIDEKSVQIEQLQNALIAEQNASVAKQAELTLEQNKSQETNNTLTQLQQEVATMNNKLKEQQTVTG